MGLFIALAGVIGKTSTEVAAGLSAFAKSVNGEFKPGGTKTDDESQCIIQQGSNGTTIAFPEYFLEWDECAAFLSRELNAPAFSFHIHDGDLWMYVLFVNGVIADQFNPVPRYWDDNISEEEAESWKGDATIVTTHVPGLKPQDIDRYLVEWDLESEETIKAYPDDASVQEDWQLLDFLNKIKLPYPISDKGEPTGDIYELWTKEPPKKLPVTKPMNAPFANQTTPAKKPWWKFW
jgi:hypothetical protein